MSDAPIILTIAFPYAPVGPAAVGGAEVLLSQLEAALPALGFRSIVVAHADSRPVGRLYPVPVPKTEITDAVRGSVEMAVQAQIDRALAENSVALVHMHGLDFARYRIPAQVPVVVTLHLPPGWYPNRLENLPANYTLICVSETQRRACSEDVRGRSAVISNGVPLPDASLLRPGGRYAVMLARICPEKNLHTGLDAARLAGMPAMLAGEVFPYPTHQRYFGEEIEPRLTRAGNIHAARLTGTGRAAEARLLGPVTGPAKARLLARAACLLLPSVAPETSSLVAMEALSYGVPVLAMASGAVPEIVEDGRTGFLVPPGSDPVATQAMAEALQRLPSLDRRICREVAAERFSFERTAGLYSELYRRLCRPIPLVEAPSQGVVPTQAKASTPVTSLDPSAHTYVEDLTSDKALEDLLPTWAVLWSQDPLATPFQHPAWLHPWWNQFGPDGELHALALRRTETGRLAAFLPLYLYMEKETGCRQILLMGAGTTDYLEGLWPADDPHLAAAQTLAYALRTLRDWQRMSLSQLRSASPLRQAAQNGLFAGQRPWIGAAEPTSVLDLTDPLPPKLRANAGRYRRRAEAAGRLEFRTAIDTTEALESFEHLLGFHADRWNRCGEPGVLSDPRVQAHHRAAIPSLLEADLLRFFRLTRNGDVLGVLYALADPPARQLRSLYLYLIGFDTAHGELSPGTLLLHEVWGYARANGFATLDFLRGGESYKHLWGVRERPTFALNVQRSLGQ